jgi:hypothetical protein
LSLLQHKNLASSTATGYYFEQLLSVINDDHLLTQKLAKEHLRYGEGEGRGRGGERKGHIPVSRNLLQWWLGGGGGRRRKEEEEEEEEERRRGGGGGGGYLYLYNPYSINTRYPKVATKKAEGVKGRKEGRGKVEGRGKKYRCVECTAGIGGEKRKDRERRGGERDGGEDGEVKQKDEPVKV